MNANSLCRKDVMQINRQQSNVFSTLEDISNKTKSLHQTVLEQINSNKRQQTELLHAFRELNIEYQSSGEFRTSSVSLSNATEVEWRRWLVKKFLSRLEYPSMNDRHEGIQSAHLETCEWIFRSELSGMGSSFVEWLKHGSGIYWITGKPGSGKSTLMKFISDDKRTYEHLALWSPNQQLTTSRFFFWNSGSNMEMSQLGLLRSLLHEALLQLPELISSTFYKRWNYYLSFGGDARPWTLVELLQSFRLLIKHAQDKQFFFLIDGLDEFDGDHMELINLLKGAVASTNVKICLSSRPWVVFEEAFKLQPSLRIQDLNYKDIKLFVTSKFADSDRMEEIEKHDPAYTRTLVHNITEKASGVFLWVRLVVQSLLIGVQNGDNASELQQRLDALPSDLEDLFRKIMDSIEPIYRRNSSQLFQIVRAAVCPLNLLQFSFADEQNQNFAIEAEVAPLTEDDIKSRTEIMKRRLNSRCKGLIEVVDISSSRVEYIDTRVPFRVQYLHRTVKDFLELPEQWARITATTDSSFHAQERLLRAYILYLKTLPPDILDRDMLWDVITWIIEYAFQLQEASGNAETELLDEFDKAAYKLVLSPRAKDGKTFMDVYSELGYCSSDSHWTATQFGRASMGLFLSFAIKCGLFAYASAKIIEIGPTAGLLDEWGLLEDAVFFESSFSRFTDRSFRLQEATPNINLIAMLLERGAKPNYASRGPTPWQYALRSVLKVHEDDKKQDKVTIQRWAQIIRLFSRYGADPRKPEILVSKSSNQQERKEFTNLLQAVGALEPLHRASKSSGIASKARHQESIFGVDRQNVLRTISKFARRKSKKSATNVH
jgi:NACHT domain